MDPANESELRGQLEDLRKIIAQLQRDKQESAQRLLLVQKEKDDLEITALAQATSTFSPVNLSSTLNAAAPIDAQQVSDICAKIVSHMEGRLLLALDSGFSTLSQQSSFSASALGAQVSAGLPGAFPSPTVSISQTQQVPLQIHSVEPAIPTIQML